MMNWTVDLDAKAGGKRRVPCIFRPRDPLPPIFFLVPPAPERTPRDGESQVILSQRRQSRRSTRL
jgi:hypothetical protein